MSTRLGVGSPSGCEQSSRFLGMIRSHYVHELIKWGLLFISSKNKMPERGHIYKRKHQGSLLPKHVSHCAYAYHRLPLEGHAEGPRAGSLVVCRLSAQLMELDLPRGNHAHPDTHGQLHLTVQAGCQASSSLASPPGQWEHLPAP